MNIDKLNRVLANYIEKYDLLNNKEHNEIYKWEAVHYFQNNWNINCEDFGEMFKSAMGRSENIIDNSIVQPCNGIIFLCKQDTKMMEEVRAEFQKLLVTDNGDYKKRLSKIDAFVSAINAMLQKVACGKWKYNQNRRAVIMYLSFIEPEDNYMFKSTEAKVFSECIEFGDEIGSGQSFRLDTYYRMCNELVNIIKENKELCGLLNAKLEYISKDKNEAEQSIITMEGKYNILAYDIIYCANAYGLYNGILQKEHVKLGSATQRIVEQKAYMKELYEKRNILIRELEAISEDKDKLQFPVLIGIQLKNIRYGLGTVIEQKGNYLTVQFLTENKKFALPDAISKGYLRGDNVELVDLCKKVSELIDKEEKSIREIRRINAELSIMED